MKRIEFETMIVTVFIFTRIDWSNPFYDIKTVFLGKQFYGCSFAAARRSGKNQHRRSSLQYLALKPIRDLVLFLFADRQFRGLLRFAGLK